MNTNQTNTNTLVVGRYENTYQVCAALGEYVRANAPDQKTRDKVREVLYSHSHMPYARDLLYAISREIDELYDRSWDKMVDSNNADAHAKRYARADFYRNIRNWADACYDLVKETPVITANIDALEKDAEDDSDPYVKPSPKADPMDHALTMLKDRLLMADFGKRRIDVAAALFKSVVLERPVGATVLDVLERFGDEASELSWGGEYEAARFWDACVLISDDLRSDLATDQIKKASTITVPDMMWEVAGDPDRALYRTKMDAERAARELFPDEYVARRYARVQYRNVKTFK